MSQKSFAEHLRVLRWCLDNNTFHLCVVLKSVFSILATMSGHFIAAKWRLSREHIVAIHPNCTSTKSLNQVIHLINVFAENSSSQAVISVIGPFDDFVQLLELDDLLDWTEDLKYLTNLFKVIHYFQLKFKPLLWQWSCRR